MVEGDTVYFRNGVALRVLVPEGSAGYRATSRWRPARARPEGRRRATDGTRRSAFAGLPGTVRVGEVNGDLRADSIANLLLQERCDGDMRFDDGGTLLADTIGGDLRIYNGEAARIERVRGDFWAEKLRGGVELDQVNGDARLSEVGGAVSIHSVAGDLRADRNRRRSGGRRGKRRRRPARPLRGRSRICYRPRPATSACTCHRIPISA